MSKSEFHPKVSIIIPVYNGSNYMCEAIESALAQTYNNIEIIVVNDGSTDDTEKIALSYGDKIRYFAKENGGQSTALNFGIDKMKGEYFSWLSHDDVYYPEKIEKQIDYLKNRQDENVIPYCNYHTINSNSEVIGYGLKNLVTHELFKLELLIGSPINGCSALIPKTAFSTISLFNTQRPHTSDVELFFDMADKYRFEYMSDTLIQSRVHSGQMTHKKASYHNYESNLFLIDSINKISPEYYISINKTVPDFYVTIALNWSKRGYLSATKTALKLYKENGGKTSKYQYFQIMSLIKYLKKTLKTNIKHLIFKLKKW